MRKADLFFNVVRLPVDFLMILLAGLMTYFLRTEILSAFRPVLFELNLPVLRFFYLVVLVASIFIGAYALSGLYSMKVRMRILEEFTKILLASSAGILTVIIYIFLRQELFDSRFLVLGGWFFAILFVCLGRLVIRYVQALAVVKYGLGIHRVLIIGDSEVAKSLTLEMNRDKSLGYNVVEQLESADIENIKSRIKKAGVDEVFLAQHGYSSELMSELIIFCHENHIIFKIIPGSSDLSATNFEIDIFRGLPLIEIKRTNLDGWGRVIKRMVDCIGATLGLILLSPILGLIAFVIKWETAGPVLVRLRRVSGNNEFELYKFRSMIENAEELKPLLASFNERKDGPLFKIKEDPRITKVGKFIRRTRIDELPQLINVLRGEISLVGPRPHQPDEIALYQKHHKKVLAIKAGITGLAQVSGSSDLNFEKEVSLDTFYINNWSWWLDLKIMLRTLLKMFFDRSAV
jgi:exopolysaccharide biosynthesis polyprenyl glycosylphosphotransferase